MTPMRTLAAALALSASLSARPTVETGRTDAGFVFEKIPSPALDDAAAAAEIAILDGRRDRNGADTGVLSDGKLPSNADQPAANFFFAAASEGGRLRIDLGKAIEVASVCSYSWHRTVRGPQVYSLYASDGGGDGFVAEPRQGSDLAKSGWTLVGKVDTRRLRGGPGGQHGVWFHDPDEKSIGRYRYLLFDVAPSDDRDVNGQTFFSEIDVVEAGKPAPKRLEPPKPVVKQFATEDGSYRFTVDATRAPELMPWVKDELMPVVFEWYPKIVELLPSDGYTAPDHVFMEFKDDMGGTPAYAAGARLSLSIPFFRAQLKGEAKGCVVHELVHVVQNYWRARVTNRRPKPTPGWVTEGIADYIRWFLYEPESKGAEITRRNLGSARYDASYRVTANFFDWVVRERHEDLLKELNAAAREGRYEEQTWKDWTGSRLDELGEQWLAAHRKRLEPGG